MRSKSSWPMPGTTALTFRWLPVMPVPGLKVTDAVVSIDVGGVPLSVSALETAMLEHAEWAAAMSSSGVVTEFDPSLRAFQLTGNEPMPDEANETTPSPSKRLPFQAVVASLVTVIATSEYRRAPHVAALRGQPNRPRRARARSRSGGALLAPDQPGALEDQPDL